jgi:hypothetical protein
VSDMLGRIVFSETKKVILRREELAGMPVQTITIPAHGPTDRRISKTARLFTRIGVRRVLVPANFLYWPQLERYGIIPVDMVPFLQAMAVPLTLAALDRSGVSPKHATVVLAGDRASQALCAAAVALCPLIQQLVIFAPSGGAKLAGFLRREYGLPLMERCKAPHLVLLFSRFAADTDAPILRLYAPRPDLMGFSLRPKAIALPDGSETLPLMAALWETGRLAACDIAVFPCEDT